LYSWDAKRVATIAGGGRLDIKDKPHGKNYFKHYHVGNHYTSAHVAYLYG